MPATYAHLRFGRQMLGKMPREQADCAKLFRRPFDVGLHGPDIFFCHAPAKTKISKLGSKIHHRPASELFRQICTSLRKHPTPAGNAYLYGVLCHYALDACCHPFINRMGDSGVATHLEIEAEFDRFLLEKDGCADPATHDISSHIRLTLDECDCISNFYPQVKPKALYHCVNNMRRINRVFTVKRGAGRTVMKKVLHLAKPLSQFIMHDSPNPRCAELNQRLFALYNHAADAFPMLLEKLQSHLVSNTPLGTEFDAEFG